MMLSFIILFISWKYGLKYALECLLVYIWFKLVCTGRFDTYTVFCSVYSSGRPSFEMSQMHLIGETILI